MRTGSRAGLATAIVALAVGLACAATPDAGGFRVLHCYHLGGEGGWDYLTLDAAAHRLYVAHGDRVMVLDTDDGNMLGTIAGLSGVHGVALAPALRRGWISDGRGDAARGLVYSPNGASGTLTVVRRDDADRYRVVAEVPTQPSARTLALDPVSGNVYLSAATIMPAGGTQRRAMAPDSFAVLVVGRAPPAAR